MKAKLFMVFIGVVVILLMAGLEIVQGEDIGYPAPIIGYPVDYGYPVSIWNIGYPVPIYEGDTGYPVYTPVPVVGYPEPIIELSSNLVQLEPIEPQYRNGRNLWQEIVFQFSKLLELMK